MEEIKEESIHAYDPLGRFGGGGRAQPMEEESKQVGGHAEEYGGGLNALRFGGGEAPQSYGGER